MMRLRSYFVVVCAVLCVVTTAAAIEYQPLVTKEGADSNGLVPLRFLFRRRSTSHERRPALRQWDDGPSVPEPVREASGRGSVVLDRQCALGSVQHRHRLRTAVPGRSLRPAQRVSRRRGRSRRRGQRHAGCAVLRTLPWRKQPERDRSKCEGATAARVVVSWPPDRRADPFVPLARRARWRDGSPPGSTC